MIKGIILSLWDRIIYFREQQFFQRLEFIAKSLPIIDHIGELGKSKKLGPEEAELLRRKYCLLLMT
jgi:hypothetical protein